jgi:hypothetical protein
MGMAVSAKYDVQLTDPDGPLQSVIGIDVLPKNVVQFTD